MSVTSFRTYLACPYRFYLRHVLGLGREDDRAIELDAAAFGNLIHEVLCRFGRSDVSQSTDVGEIRGFLRVALRECIEQWYGRDLLPAVNVQSMQAQVRLDAFADWQADWARAGWRIRYTEVPEPGTVTRISSPDGRSMMLHGRLDRLDQHQETGEWFVFDYKTSTAARGPSATHRRSGQWVDLQLPLYRHLAASLDITGRPRLGYINLPSDTSKVGHWEAEWSEKELAEADKLAADVVAKVLDAEFWPPAYPPPPFSDDYAAICQDDVFERHLETGEVA